ncbi:DUF805 domain-containing protein [Haloferula chungangensis]|uniref:DUF805 domain-containing protein n=1 Tax=Haloferula chungangensis TaxID=1048331 RepID=A0ABW2L3Q2_9BACT
MDPYTPPTSDSEPEPGGNRPEVPEPNRSAISTLFGFRGRITRATFWLCLGPVLIQLGLGWFVFIDFLNPQDLRQHDTYYVIPSLPLLALAITALVIPLWIIIALQVKRWHDHSKSAWWLLIWLTPLGFVWVPIELGFVRGSPFPNKYGPDPLRIRKVQ